MTDVEFAPGINLEPDDGIIGPLRVHRQLKMVLANIDYPLHEQDRRVPE